MQLHPQILQVIKPKIPEIEKVILFQQKSNRVNTSSVYGSSGANGWLPNLKSRLAKATAQTTSGPSRSVSYVKRKLPMKGSASTTSIGGGS